MAHSSKIEPVILIDSREQLPYSLPNSRIATLKTGDYSIEGFDDRIAVERKSLIDLYGCFAQSRDRFTKELIRLATLPFPAIVVEATLFDILTGPRHSQVNRQAAIGSLLAWGTRYRIPVWLCGDRRMAAGAVRKILYAALKEIGGMDGDAES